MRVLFWGTPEFAAAPLRALIGEGSEVIGVVTQPDRPQGRSRVLTAPPVKQIAIEERIPVFQPARPKDPDFVEMLVAMQPDISIVVAYGHILPRQVIDLPRLGTLNIHASLLPALRGAAPIQAAIRLGLRETGVTIMRMVAALDAGPILLKAKVPILDDETYGELQMRLSELGALTLLEALALMSIGEAVETVQDDGLATYASKVSRDDARMDWSLGAVEVARMVRAYDPKPGAFTTRAGTDVKMFGPRVIPAAGSGDGQPAKSAGEVVATEGGVVVACGDGAAVGIADVQPAGKARMTSAEWARGRGVAAGDRLGE
ncbi:MAG: methionyl-tRNA formyltransferase [Gemmatimonadaceae bacterium]|nr:methionyl-tRNA formyltransferase [Gemmatimonadaceae bacterium]